MANSIHLLPDSLGQPESRSPSKLFEPGIRADSRFTDRAQRCHAHVRGRKGGSSYNEYAVCNASIIRKRGKQGAYKPGHYQKD